MKKRFNLFHIKDTNHGISMYIICSQPLLVLSTSQFRQLLNIEYKLQASVTTSKTIYIVIIIRQRSNINYTAILDAFQKLLLYTKCQSPCFLASHWTRACHVNKALKFDCHLGGNSSERWTILLFARK
jgi:hypothetical protein